MLYPTTYSHDRDTEHQCATCQEWTPRLFKPAIVDEEGAGFVFLGACSSNCAGQAYEGMCRRARRLGVRR
jgi:hypothetical protein